MYDTEKTKISLGVLIEVNEALRAYRSDFALVGGWAPYFITKGHFDHCGSIDIDLVFGPRVFRRYESIREIITALGFAATANPFRFERTVVEDLKIELDFLSEQEALQAIPSGFVNVQEDLSAVIIPGSSIALRSNFEAETTGTLPDGSELSSRVKVADLVAMTALKGHALGRPRKLEKDCYDLYAICGFTGGDPSTSSAQFASHLLSGRILPSDRRFVSEGLERLEAYFRTQNSRGPLAVSRFYGIDQSKQIDSHARVSTFLRGVQLE
jgi:Nucleotidyl transferase AbiEii toxin, Type IV TA system